MTAYRGAPEPAAPTRKQLWLLPQGRAAVLTTSLLVLFAVFMTVSLLRVESPVAVAGLALALVAGRMLDASFGRLIVEGDELTHRRGLTGLRTRSLSVANGCTVRVVTAAGESGGQGGPRRPAPRHRVEVAALDPSGVSWVIAEETRRAAAEAIADWLRQNLPSDRLRVAQDDPEQVRVAEPEPPRVGLPAGPPLPRGRLTHRNRTATESVRLRPGVLWLRSHGLWPGPGRPLLARDSVSEGSNAPVVRPEVRRQQARA